MRIFVLVGQLRYPARVTAVAETLEEAVAQAKEGDFVVLDEEPDKQTFEWGQEETIRAEQIAERETPSVDQFLVEIGEVCRKHGYSIGHEDGHGAFIINTFNESDLEWLGHALVQLGSDEEPQPVCTCTLANVDYINDCPVHDGRTMAKYEEARAEREMVQAQTPVVNEDGE